MATPKAPETCIMTLRSPDARLIIRFGAALMVATVRGAIRKPSPIPLTMNP